MATRQSRGGRLPLPSSVRRLDESEEPPLTLVHRFVDVLGELPLGEWLEIGRRVAGDQRGIAARTVAWAELDRVLVQERLGIAAWHVRDAVQTAAFLVARIRTPLSRAERRELTAAQGAAEEAALALLTREHLPRNSYQALNRTFASLLPQDDRESP